MRTSSAQLALAFATLLLGADAGCGGGGGGAGGTGGAAGAGAAPSGGGGEGPSAGGGGATGGGGFGAGGSGGSGGAEVGGAGGAGGTGGAGGSGGAGGAGGAGGTGGAGGAGGAAGAGGGGGAGGSGGEGGHGGGTVCTGDPQGGADLPNVMLPLPDVVVTTIAGSDVPGTADGIGAAAAFDNPVNLLPDGLGNSFIADFDNGRIRVVDQDRNVTTLTTDPGFARPFGLALASTGELLVQTDFDATGMNAGDDGGVIWGIDLQTGVPLPIATQVGRPRGMVRLPNGLIVVSDILRHDIRLFDPSTASFTPLAGLAGCPDFADAPNGAAARFNRPYGLAVTASGDVLVADQNNHRIRLIDMPSGAVSTFAGDGTSDLVDGFLADARFSQPQDLTIDAAGDVFVSDLGNHRIRRISAGGIVETVAGGDQQGFADGDGEAARFFGQEGIEVTPDGNTILVADGTLGTGGLPYHRIRKIELQ